jgi:hypothetical protein
MTVHDGLRGDDVLDDLRAELAAVSPSAEFVARVRGRIAGQSTVRSWGWVWAACGAAAIAVLIAVSLRSGGDVASVRPPAIATQPVAAPTLAVAPTQDVVPAGRPSQTPAARRRPAPRTVDARLEVMTNQPAVLEQLWRAAIIAGGRRRIVAAELPTEAVGDPDALLRVPQLVVDPIVVPPIGTAAGGQGRVQRVVSPQATGSPK